LQAEKEQQHVDFWLIFSTFSSKLFFHRRLTLFLYRGFISLCWLISAGVPNAFVSGFKRGLTNNREGYQRYYKIILNLCSKAKQFG